MAMDVDRWFKHFRNSRIQRSSDMVPIPRDVFDFVLETLEAFNSHTDDTPVAMVAAAEGLARDLLRGIAAQHQPSQ
jgi:hypothetical protein